MRLTAPFLQCRITRQNLKWRGAVSRGICEIRESRLTTDGHGSGMTAWNAENTKKRFLTTDCADGHRWVLMVKLKHRNVYLERLETEDNGENKERLQVE